MIMIPPRHELLWKSDNKAVQVEKKDKKGHVVHHSITHLKAEDLQGLGGGGGDGGDAQNLTLEQASQGREELIAILQDAGVQEMDPAAIAKLPTWKQVTDLYGDTKGPVIYGLDSCAKFRKDTPPDDASVGTAGLFNTGTNPLSMYLQANCEIPTNTHDKFKGMRWQVPVRQSNLVLWEADVVLVAVLLFFFQSSPIFAWIIYSILHITLPKISIVGKAHVGFT